MRRDEYTERQPQSWRIQAWEPSLALVKAQLKLRADALTGHGYHYLAQLGHHPSERIKFHPREIPFRRGCLWRIGSGFRGVLYRSGSLALKVNHNLSFEVERELRNHRLTLARLGHSHPELIRCLEVNYGLVTFPKTQPPVSIFRQDPKWGRYFLDQHVLIKEYLEGLTIRHLVEQRARFLLRENLLRQLGQLFLGCAEAGILFQGDPDDFVFQDPPPPEEGYWVALDPDGWVPYQESTPHVLRAARGAFVGTFGRLLSELDEASSRQSKTFLREVIVLVEELADHLWGEVNEPPFDPEAFRCRMAEDDLLSPEDPTLKALIRAEWQNPLALDVELGRCSLNVMITRKALLHELFKLRSLDPGTEDLSEFYFGDLGILWGERYVAIYNSYNDNENPRSGDWAYNHTGIPNREIAAAVLAAAEERL